MGYSGGELERIEVELRCAESELGHSRIWLGSTGAELGYTGVHLRHEYSNGGGGTTPLWQLNNP